MCDRIVACQQKRHGVVTKLARRRVIIGLAGLTEQGEQVIPCAARPATRHDVVDNRVECASCRLCAATRRDERDEAVHGWDGARDGGFDVRGHGCKVGAEQRLSRDRECQAPHLAPDVESDPGLPSLSAPSGVVDDERRGRFQSVTVKRGLQDTASRRMQRPFCREQAVAQESLRPIESAAFHEPIVMRQEDVFDRRGVIEEECEARAQLKRDDRVRAPCQLLQEGEWVSLPATQSPERARRIGWRSHRVSLSASRDAMTSVICDRHQSI